MTTATELADAERCYLFALARLADRTAAALRMEHFTVHEEPYYSCPGSLKEPLGDLPSGEEHCDCFLKERKAQAILENRVLAALLHEHRPIQVPGGPPGRWTCRICTALVDGQGTRVTAPCWTLLLLVALWPDHPDYEQKWVPWG